MFLLVLLRIISAINEITTMKILPLKINLGKTISLLFTKIMQHEMGANSKGFYGDSI